MNIDLSIDDLDLLYTAAERQLLARTPPWAYCLLVSAPV